MAKMLIILYLMRAYAVCLSVCLSICNVSGL